MCECGKKAIYGFKDDTFPIKCRKCKTPGMININIRRCEKCARVAKYGPSRSEMRERCSLHQKIDDILYDGTCQRCGKGAYFNYSYKYRGIYCFEHKLRGMVNIKSGKSCIICRELPAEYNWESKYKRGKLYCKNHKLSGMVKV